MPTPYLHHNMPEHATLALDWTWSLVICPRSMACNENGRDNDRPAGPLNYLGIRYIRIVV